MAFVCPVCKKETLSPRSAEVKVCLRCGSPVDWQNVTRLLEKIGVRKKIVDQVRSDINRVIKRSEAKAAAEEL